MAQWYVNVNPLMVGVDSSDVGLVLKGASLDARVKPEDRTDQNGHGGVYFTVAGGDRREMLTLALTALNNGMKLNVNENPTDSGRLTTLQIWGN